MCKFHFNRVADLQHPDLAVQSRAHSLGILVCVQRELQLLEQVRQEEGGLLQADLEPTFAAINAELWTIEDAIHEREAASDFGESLKTRLDLTRPPQAVHVA